MSYTNAPKGYSQCFNREDDSNVHELHKRDSAGMTPLMIAASVGWIEGVKYLKKCGSNLALINGQDRFKLTALMHAAGRQRMVEGSAFIALYHTYNINTDLTDHQGRTYLMNATASGREDIIYHVKYRAKLANVQDKSGRTALLYSVLEITKQDKNTVSDDQNQSLSSLYGIHAMDSIHRH
ncbi:ankyrin repeat-containing domain protein [Podospora fimiseda]|uniref:Ankyrin repeat-containing domain protein n=1 Tax=Podospora fimiseda TaxID=252190 RepID=A0AAN7BR75_9PEZI|nr:ankyrin repeat-containing domain protein [Podospora fimiseda]